MYFFQYADAIPVLMAPGLIHKTLVSGDNLIRQATLYQERSALPWTAKAAFLGREIATPPPPAPCTRRQLCRRLWW